MRVPVFAFGLDEGGEGVGSTASTGAGTTRARAFELGAKMPWYRTEWILGGGTRVASRAAAVQVGAKLPFDEGGEAVTVGAPFPGRGEERLQPLPDDLVQEGLLGFAPVVPTERRARRARLALPDLAGLGRGHARTPRKRRARSWQVRHGAASSSMTRGDEPCR